MEKEKVRITVKVEGGEKNLEISREMPENEAIEYFEKISSELEKLEGDRSKCSELKRMSYSKKDKTSGLQRTSYQKTNRKDFKALTEAQKRHNFER